MVYGTFVIRPSYMYVELRLLHDAGVREQTVALWRPAASASVSSKEYASVVPLNTLSGALRDVYVCSEV